MSFLEKLNKNRSNIYLVQGTDRGRKAWYYVQVEPMKVPLFLKEAPGKQVNLEDYGRIVYSGYGEEPPEDIKKKVEEGEAEA